MPTYRYRAYAFDGGLAEGTVEAASPDAASEMLWAQGLTSFQMRPANPSGTKWWNRDISFGDGAHRADLVAFTREFAMLNAAEIPLDDALRIQRQQASSSRLRVLVDGLLADVLNGTPLSDAMQKQAKSFPPIISPWCAPVKSGGPSMTSLSSWPSFWSVGPKSAHASSRR